MSVTGGAGGLAASLDDMVAFDRALREHRLASPDLERQMHSPARLSSGRSEGYGLGWVLTRYRGAPVVSHAGGIDGFSSFYARFPGHDASIIILANRDGFSCYRLARAITDLILCLPAHPRPAATPGPVPAGLAGTYRDTLTSAQLAMDGNRLLIEHAGITRQMIPAGHATYIDETDHDIRLHVHTTGRQPAAVTIDYPFTWFTGYRSQP